MRNNQDSSSSGHLGLILSTLGVGGTQRVMLYLMAGFLKVGYEVDAVVVNARGPFIDHIPAGVNLVDLGVKQTLYSVPMLIRYLRENRPQAILSGLTHVNLAAIAARWLSGIKTRLVVSERSNLTEKRKESMKLMDKISFFLINYFYPLADAVVCVSQDAANDLKETTRLDPKKVFTIYNPLPVNEVRKLAQQKIEHPWFNEKRMPIILAVGRLSRPKDYPTLIKAFNIFRTRREVKLIIIGEGEERPAIEQYVSSSPFLSDIALLGSISNPYPYMAGTDVFVLSSAWEGFPNVLVEALACGATVVSTDCHSGPAEILDNGKYGRLVPVGDPQALADAIELSLDHPFPAEQGIARARDFSVEKAARQYLKVLFPDHDSEQDNQ